MTTDPDMGADAASFFNALTGYSDPPDMRKLVMAPTRLRERLLALIDRERKRAEQGQAAAIDAKMNALVDEEIIRALYAASAAGVRIRLNMRGICCLRPDVEGLSETIDVVSIARRCFATTSRPMICKRTAPGAGAAPNPARSRTAPRRRFTASRPRSASSPVRPGA